MCKRRITLTLLLLAVCQQVCSDASAFSVFRSTDIQVNPAIHKESSLSAFALPGLRVEADLAGQPNEEGDQVETHPIDFSRIDLSKHSPTGRGVLNSMQNDEVRPPINQFDGRRSFSRFGAQPTKWQARSSGPRSTVFASKFDRNPLLDYDYYCSPSNYLAECLRKRLLSKFLKRFRSTRSAASGLRSTIEDLNRFSSSVESPANAASAAQSIKQVSLALDRTFYDTDFLSPMLSDCIVTYQRNCDQITKQPLFQ